MARKTKQRSQLPSFARIATALLLAAPFAASAQDEAGEAPPAQIEAGGEAAGAAAAARPSESPAANGEDGDGAGAPEAPTPVESDAEEHFEVDESLRSTALLFFQAIIAGVPEAMVELADYPFNLDGVVIERRPELTRRLREALRSADLSRVPFYGMRAYPAARMIEEFGPPPRRLEDLDLEDAWVAVANLGGHAHVAVFQNRNGSWRVVAYTE